ncbi:MAG: DEAD/DEAH box helicase, partial [Infirmifilum sp.]
RVKPWKVEGVRDYKKLNRIELPNLLGARLECLRAWSSFLLWRARLATEPHLSSLRARIVSTLLDLKIGLARALRGRHYPFTLLDQRVIKAFERRAGGRLPQPTPIQVLAIPKVLKGDNVLIVAPTGSGKTEAAVLPVLHRLVVEKDAAKRSGKSWPYGVHALYITPLRALCTDIAKRLERYVMDVFEGFYYYAGAWHTDVESEEKKVMRERPPLVLVTTPESLESMLDRNDPFLKHLAHLKYVIVDEVHELAETKRGHQLLILLERLKLSLGIKRLQRILISATTANPKRIARLFGGSDGRVKVVSYPRIRGIAVELAFNPRVDEKEVAELLIKHVDRGALIFVNTRAEAEGLHAALDSLKARDIGVHHSAVASEEKRRIEEEFKRGRLRAVVCTRTLELGIDIGMVEKVVQLGSPSLPEALAQRLGRSQHKPGRRAQGVVLCLSDKDLVEVLALASMLGRGALASELKQPLYLDVVARTIVATAFRAGKTNSDAHVEEVLRALKLAAPYRELGEEELKVVLEVLLSQRVVELENGRIRLGPGFEHVWGRRLRKRPEEGKTDVQKLYSPSFFSFIPEREYLYVVSGRRKIGEIDPVNLRYVRKGSVIRLAGRSWRVVRIAGRTVYVKPEEEARFSIPVWRGGYVMTPRAVSVEMYRLISKLARRYGMGEPSSVFRLGEAEVQLHEQARGRLGDLLRELSGSGLPVPGPGLMIIERLARSEATLKNFIPKRRNEPRFGATVLLYPFGERVAATLAAALWSTKKVWRVIPEGYGIFLEHDHGFDPLRYMVQLSEEELRRSISSSTNPYVVAMAYEVRKSFGFKKLGDALKSRLVLDESARQATARFYDVEGVLQLLLWLRHGCVKTLVREVKEPGELHPLTRRLFQVAEKYLEKRDSNTTGGPQQAP